MTFTGADALASLEEGSPPEFNCMKEHYGMSFVKGDAGSDIAEGTLTSEKVRNDRFRVYGGEGAIGVLREFYLVCHRCVP